MNVLNATCCVPHKLGENGKVVHVLFFTHDLDLQSSHFKVTMMHNSKAVLQEENSLNPMTRLWRKIIANPILNHKLLKFMKLAEIDVVQVFGLVEDEHTFSIVNFMKSRLWNWLKAQLSLNTCFFNHRFFTLQSFPYDQAIAKW
jgi:hypothetical protein